MRRSGASALRRLGGQVPAAAGTGAAAHPAHRPVPCSCQRAAAGQHPAAKLGRVLVATQAGSQSLWNRIGQFAIASGIATPIDSASGRADDRPAPPTSVPLRSQRLEIAECHSALHGRNAVTVALDCDTSHRPGYPNPSCNRPRLSPVIARHTGGWAKCRTADITVCCAWSSRSNWMLQPSGPTNGHTLSRSVLTPQIASGKVKLQPQAPSGGTLPDGSSTYAPLSCSHC